MDRRLAGVVLLVIALVAASVVPALSGRRVVGAPVPIALAAPPKVGQCLTAGLSRSTELASTEHPLVRAITMDETSFTKCAGVVGGEVVAVWPDAAVAGFASGPTWRNPCYRSTAGFAGLVRSDRSTDLPGAPPGDPVRWRPAIGFQAIVLTPGAVERRAGQDWIACLAAPTADDGFTGSLRNAFTSGSMPAQFASCWAGTELDQLPAGVGCDRPHQAELLAQGWLRDPVGEPAETVQESCSELAGRIMHTTDPTRGGELAVVVDRLDSAEASRPYGPQPIACLVTSAGPQQLSGTLIGLADRPVPLVG